jgi:hypothetical protein
MRWLVFFILLLWQASMVLGNDGAFFGEGGVFRPMSETQVELQREDLFFTIRDDTCRVDIRFVFNNPTKDTIRLKVGFEAPGAVGDVTNTQANAVPIKDFRVAHEGRILPYAVFESYGCDTCALKPLGSIPFQQVDPGLFVFLFEMAFPPGETVLQHSYRFPKSQMVGIPSMYSYILASGARWAGASIGTLHVHVDFGPNSLFYATDVFGASAEWSIVGIGRIVQQARSAPFEERDLKQVRIVSGRLHIEVQDFHPEANLSFMQFSDSDFSAGFWMGAPEEADTDRPSLCNLLYVPEEYGLEELRLLRNQLYAQHGYAFRDLALKEYFAAFDWYMPDPNLKQSDIRFSEAERGYLQKLLLRESELRGTSE